LRSLSGKYKSNFLVVLVEFDINVSGLGIGIILEGNIYRGASFSAGELYPHMPNLRQLIDMVRPRFSEGKKLKDYITNPEELDVDKMSRFTKEGDEIATLIFSMLGRRIGEIIAPAVALFNPDTLIITGNISELGSIIIKPIENSILMNVLSVTSNPLNITASKNQQFAVAIGAASLILSNFFKLPMSNF
jgi:predicted NBD/HSP70 family sugar kinase